MSRNRRFDVSKTKNTKKNARRGKSIAQTKESLERYSGIFFGRGAGRAPYPWKPGEKVPTEEKKGLGCHAGKKKRTWLPMSPGNRGGEKGTERTSILLQN